MGLFSKKVEAPFWGALFDFDGTLLNTERWFEQAWWNILARRGLRHQDYDAEWHAGLMGDQYFRIVMERYGIDESLKAFAEEWQREADGLVAAHAELCPGVLKTLKGLKKLKVRMAVVTGSHRKFVEKLLLKHSILTFFEIVISKEYLEFHNLRGKPAPDPYYAASHAMQIPTNKCIAFEDSINGVLSAKIAGCRTVIGVVNYHDFNQNLKKEKWHLLQGAGANDVFMTLEAFSLKDSLLTL